jgi:hypothetical protein
MKCRNCGTKFSVSFGGVESSPGIFFLLALATVALVGVFASLNWPFWTGLSLVTLVVALLVMCWKWVLCNLGGREEGKDQAFGSGCCRNCGLRHFVWPWSL